MAAHCYQRSVCGKRKCTPSTLRQKAGLLWAATHQDKTNLAVREERYGFFYVSWSYLFNDAFLSLHVIEQLNLGWMSVQDVAYFSLHLNCDSSVSTVGGLQACQSQNHCSTLGWSNRHFSKMCGLVLQPAIQWAPQDVPRSKATGVYSSSLTPT
jgi:hypothetical protein